ncbi:Hyaluronidase [Chitinophaga sp. YR573]|uniref:hypothetical protein n=1 Tax=Chitinophaga sp. YR573 TaxID=1881040 RepID=UPI0008B78D4B|nr:hypothetical protein [Chitinophaga sp. YR573]SEW44491.1 Hyaluronidase [Chitinophaga sp. YR573]
MKRLGTLMQFKSASFTIMLIFVVSNIVNGQSKFKVAGGPKLYIGMEDVGPKLQSFMDQKNIMRVHVIYQRYVEPKGDMKVDESLLVSTIERIFPDKNASGIGIMDIEGKPAAILYAKDEDDPDYQSILNNYYLKALRIAKNTRPNVYWGYYNLPFNAFWNRTDKWKANSKKVASLLRECDIMFPSLYEYYPNSRVISNQSYVNDNLANALSLAKQLGVPVMPFVWHRWHPSNHKIGYTLISLDDFKSHVQSILSAGKGNPLFAGIVWWGYDAYLNKVKNNNLMKEVAVSRGNFNDYHDDMTLQYATEIMKLFK